MPESRGARTLVLAGCIGIGALASLPAAGQAAAVQQPGAKATATGTWKIRTTDCAFGCHLTVTVAQEGHVLTSPTDPNVYGTISGKVMVLADSVSPGDRWECEGNLHKTDTKWRGGFTAVSGTTTTTGTFTATKS
jgi:hypothetical protein